ncbi:MAG TPA: glycoside hydrolase family 76 protein, partial [Clostridia bacterium]|nr:glycoside hydrolase family 76 protein [Clostridia bacterium]
MSYLLSCCHPRPVRRGLLAACLFTGLFTSVTPARAVSAADADAAFAAYNSAFYVLNNGRGYYKADTSGGRADFWKWAEEIEMIIDAYDRSRNPAHKTMISQSIDGFISYHGSDWRSNKYNDDLMWMVIASCRGYLATGNAVYRDRARYNFDTVYARGWDSALGGGIWWTTDNNEKNACINGPAAIAACYLYEILGDTNYLEKAKAIYQWERSVLFDANTGKVYDNINANGVVNSAWIFTYNQGTFIGAANYLYKLTGLASYYNDAMKAALYTKNSMCTNEILNEPGMEGDGAGFTSIFLRWMARFANDNNLWDTFYVWFRENADAAWAVRRADNLSWCRWRTPTPAGTIPSWACANSVVMLQVLPYQYRQPALNHQPVPLQPGSFNRDVIVESNAPAPPLPGAFTTGAMDGGSANSGKTFYETGYNTNAGAASTGLPLAGSTFTSATYSDHQFRMAPSYSANNAALLNSSVTSATLTLASPSACSGLSFLVAGGGGSGVVRATVFHQDGSAQTNLLSIPDWFNSGNRAWTANGRVDVQSFVFDYVNAGNPRLFSVDIAVANATSPVTKIGLAHSSGANNVIFAVSRSTGAAYTPLAVTGYNRDLIVERGAGKLGPVRNVTTATMENGVLNTSTTLYEQGYLPSAPFTGLPPAGATFTSLAAPDHHFTLAADYTTNNAVVLSAALPSANLALAAPAPFAALSLLAASSRGPVTLACVLRHADGTVQNRTLSVPDWYNNLPSLALVTHGRININTGIPDAVAANNPRLYALDLPVNNTLSPVTNVGLNFVSGVNASALVFALSGIPAAVPPQIVLQTEAFTCMEHSLVKLSARAAGTAPLAYRWQKGTNGVFVDLADGPNVSGSATTNLSLLVRMSDQADYRVIASNAHGSATSLAAGITVFSALPDITVPGDAITSFGGGSPLGEQVEHAIDNSTSKYLNFGLNNGSGTFSGPVGFVVTPASGLTVVNFLRFYTANDEPGRDPLVYALFGSND